MPKTTITEALAEIKTISARIHKKREAVMRYFSRDAKLRDPLEKEGGSQEFVRKERQAIADLEGNIVTIRSAIQHANLRTSLTVGEQKRTVAEWFNWRREVAPGQKSFLQLMANQLTQVRQHAVRQGMVVTSAETYTPGEVFVAVNEQELAAQIEQMERILGDLDGQLSLLNATTTIEY